MGAAAEPVEKSLKDQGNEEFKAGNFLKAAATYTKAIKQDPENAVLFSNRCAALLKLNKVSKALADADDCIKIRADWDKGYFRKAAVLEAMGKYAESLDCYRQAEKLNPNDETVRKVKSLTKLARTKAPESKAQGGKIPSAVSNDAQYQESAEIMVGGEKIPYTEKRVLDFGEEKLQEAASQLTEKGSAAMEPMVYFLPGRKSKTGEESWGQASIGRAFDSPDTLVNCLDFLRSYAKDHGSHAACAIIPKKDIAYPQVWLKQGWDSENADGVFVQLESRKVRKMWFVPYTAKKGARPAVPLGEKFRVLEALIR